MIKGIFERNVPGSTGKLAAKAVGIAGCGGLGSNAAASLVRAGIGRLILVDHDRVEASNLNRQYFFQDDIGRVKVEALADRLRKINPELSVEAHDIRLEPARVAEVFAGADILIEAFDRAESKHWLIEAWCLAFPERPVVCASGLSGLGSTSSLAVRSSGNIYFVGDEKSDLSMGLCASRVAAVANMQANIAIALLTGTKDV